jgi:hypothetical protein
MKLRLSVFLFVVAVAAPAFPQQPSPATGTAANGAIATATPGLDLSRLPVNIGRIGRQLKQAEVREDRNGLRLHYTIDVFGEAPKIEFITPLDNILTGAVPRTSPTHQEMLQMMTPKEFSSPVINLLTVPRKR